MAGSSRLVDVGGKRPVITGAQHIGAAGDSCCCTIGEPRPSCCRNDAGQRVQGPASYLVIISQRASCNCWDAPNGKKLVSLTLDGSYDIPYYSAGSHGEPHPVCAYYKRFPLPDFSWRLYGNPTCAGAGSLISPPGYMDISIIATDTGASTIVTRSLAIFDFNNTQWQFGFTPAPSPGCRVTHSGSVNCPNFFLGFDITYIAIG